MKEESRWSPSSSGKTSMRVLLICCIIGAQVVTALSVMLIEGVFSNRAILKQSHELLAQHSDVAGARILDFFAPMISVAELHQSILGSDPIDQIEPSITKSDIFVTLQTHPEIAGVFFARPDGFFIHMMQHDGTSALITETMVPRRSDVEMVMRDKNFQRLNESFLPRNKCDPLVIDWVALTESSRDSVWALGDSLNLFGSASLTLTVPIHQTDSLVGVIGIEFLLQTLVSTLESDTRSRGEFLTLGSDDGDVILHLNGLDPITDTAMSELVSSGHLNPEIVGQINLAVTDESWLRYIDIAGQKEQVLTNVQRLDIGPGLSRILSIRSQISGLTEPIEQNQLFVASLSIFTLILLCSLAFPIANYICHPVIAFSRQSRSASEKGQTDFVVPYIELEEAGWALAEEISQRRTFQTAYRRTFEVSSRGMAQINTSDLRLVQVNEKLCQLLAMDAGMLQTQVLGSLILCKKQDTLSSFLEVLNNDGEFTVEAEFRTGTGQPKWLQMNVILIRDYAGYPKHALASFDDITDTRRRGTKLEKLNRGLDRVGRINMMGQFAVGLAHELHQPLCALMHDVNTAQFILNESEIDQHELKEILIDIDNHTRRASAIIRALRHMVQKDSQSSETISLDDLFEQTFAVIEHEVRGYGVCLRKPADTGLIVKANLTQVSQVLINLILNACEAIYHSGADNGTININTQHNGSRVKLFVEDNGPGFPDNIKPFEQFTSTKATSMGLGLSICKSMIKANNGAISYVPVATGGTIFIVELNVEEPHAKRTASID